MIYLLCLIFVSVCFLQFFRWGQVRGARLPAMIGVNYIIAFFAHLIYGLVSTESIGVSGQVFILKFSIINGFLYFAHLVVMIKCFRFMGVGVTSAVAATGVTLPVLAGVFFWNDNLSVFQWLGLFLMPVAAILLRPAGRARIDRSWKSYLLLFLNFLFAGCIATIHKRASLLPAGDAQQIYRIYLFASAALFSTGFVLVRRIKPSLYEMVTGVIIGCCNASIVVFMLLALASLPTVVVFPAGRCTAIILNLTMGYLVWKERVIPRQLAGCATALGVLLLVIL